MKRAKVYLYDRLAGRLIEKTVLLSRMTLVIWLCQMQQLLALHYH